MPTFCTVKRALAAFVIDGPDEGFEPDRIRVQGQVTFTPVLGKGDAVTMVEDGEPVTVVPHPIEARINDGQIMHRGRVGVDLLAGGPQMNPPQLVWKATFANLQSGGTPFSLRPVQFVAKPGGSVDLTLVAPAANVPNGVSRGPGGAALTDILVDGSELVVIVTDEDGERELTRLPLDDIVRAEADAAAGLAAQGVKDDLAAELGDAAESASDANASAQAAAQSASDAAGSAQSAHDDAELTADDRRQTGEDRAQAFTHRQSAGSSASNAADSRDAAAQSASAAAQSASDAGDAETAAKEHSDQAAIEADRAEAAADGVDAAVDSAAQNAAAAAADGVRDEFTGLRDSAEGHAQAAGDAASTATSAAGSAAAGVRAELSDIASAVAEDAEAAGESAATATGAATAASNEADRAAAQIRMFQVVNELPDPMEDGVIYAVRKDA